MKITRYIYIILVIIGDYSCSDAQIYFKTLTQINDYPISYRKDSAFVLGDNLRFEHSFYWKKRVDNSGKEKDAYLSHSLYYRDSIIGVRLVGFNFRLFHEKFSTGKMNFFRYWNRIRLGFSFMLEKNYFHSYYSSDDYYKYLNVDFFVRYLYISRRSRGDSKTRYRKGTWSILFYSDFKNRVYTTFEIKPFGFAWVRLQFHRTYLSRKTLSLLFDFALNSDGYSRSLVTSTKDSYKGVKLIVGPVYDLDSKYWSINLGLRFDYRNH